MPRPAFSYSVLTHESLVDSAWDAVIAPMLKARFPSADAAAFNEARAYAYGGSVMPDMGYYTFGSHFFTRTTSTSTRLRWEPWRTTSRIQQATRWV